MAKVFSCALASLLLLGTQFGALIVHAADSPIVLQEIAFGSCAHQDKPAPVWDTLAKSPPDAFIFLGDNIYGDSKDISVLRAKYDKLIAKPGYSKLRQSCPILPVWDDHDYGVNDGGAEYVSRVGSQALFADAFNLPKDSPVRQRPGTYDAHLFGPADKRVQVILLDTRYFRGPLKKRAQRGNIYDGSPGPFEVNPTRSVTLLGSAQWKWLEEQLRVPARLRIIASSIQFVSNHHGWEKWGNLPHERYRFLKLIESTNANGVLFLSGDRHHSEISRLQKGPAGYPLYDVTASGLTHGKGWDNEINPHRIGAMYRDPNYGSMLIDWDADDPEIRLQIHNPAGALLIRHTLKLSDIQPPE